MDYHFLDAVFSERDQWNINERNDLMKSRIRDIELDSFTPIARVEKLITECMLDLEYLRPGTKQLYALHLEIEYDGDEWGLRSDEVCEFVNFLENVQQEVLNSNEKAVTRSIVQNLRAYIDFSKHLKKICWRDTEIWLRARAVADQTSILLYSILVEEEADTDLNLKLTQMIDPTHPDGSAFYFKIFNSSVLSHKIPETEKMNFIDHLLLYLKNQIIHCQNPALLKDHSEKLILYKTLVKATISYSENISNNLILYGSIIKHATTLLSFAFSNNYEEKNLDESFNQFVGHFVHYNSKSLLAQLEKFSECMALLKFNFSYPPLQYMFRKIILQEGIDELMIIMSSVDGKKRVDDTRLPREFDVANFIDEFKKFLEDAKEMHDLQLDMKYKVIGEEAIGEYIDGLEELLKQYLSSNKQAITSVQNLRSFQHLSKVILKCYIDEDVMNNFKSRLLVVVEHTTKFLCSCWIEPEKNHEVKLTQLLQMNTIKDPTVQSIYVRGVKLLTRSEYSPWPDKHVVASLIDHLLSYLEELVQCETKSIVASSKEKLESHHRYLTDFKKLVAVEDIELSSRVHLMPSTMQENLHSLVIKSLMAMAMTKATLSINDLEEDEEGEKYFVLLDDLEENFTLMKMEVWKSFTFDHPAVGGDFASNFKNLEELLTLKTDLLSPLKHELEMVNAEVLKPRSFLDEIKDKSTEREEQVNDLQQRIIIQSFMMRDAPTYYHALQLSVIKDDIQFLITEMKEYDTSNSADLVVGFVDEREKIFDQVKGISQKRNVVAIVGMPGLGKTTIAKSVYNHSSVANRFDRRAWCCVSQSYQTRELLLQILRSIIVVNDDQILKKNDEDIAKLLYQTLKKRRYLIVLDDVWETKAWEDLKKSFPDDNNGSRVIVTSRDLHVSQQLIQATTNGYVHPLRVFHVEESFELLERKLFPKAKFPEILSDAARKIAEQCRGLPLTVLLAAGILSGMEMNKDLWEAFGQSLGTHIFSEEGNPGRNIIELSYKHLPDHLKCCFLYFGAFPEDMNISARKLARLWIAEGFVRDADGERLEDIAEKYLMELISRSLVIGSKSVFSPGIKSCHVHDLLRDFCITKAEEENFLHVVRGYDKEVHSWHEMDPIIICHLQYRLSIYSKREDFILAKPFAPNAHTLFFHAFEDMDPNFPYDASFISRYFKLIKVLDLGSLNIGDSFTEIALMLHLRYLEVEGSIGSIPETIDNLWKLETLIIRGSSLAVISVPNSIWNLLKLRHLHIDGYTSIKFNSKGIAESTILADMESFFNPNYFLWR